MNQTISGAQFKKMLIAGAAFISREEQSINNLNVFPVPDGDTGTNMSLTMQTAVSELSKAAPESVEQTASIAASALLRGARGNSGVILSILFRGISRGLKGCAEADGVAFANAMREGVTTAYGAVMKPAEGTILTVSRLAADRAIEAAAENNDVTYVLEQALRQGEATLAETMKMNPVLEKAGVIDAGGRGYIVILTGMLAALRGEAIPEIVAGAAQESANFAAIGAEDITFTYDTVFIVRKHPDTPIMPFRAYLDSIGDSIVVGEDDDTFKVHVHTDIPGEVLTESQKYGTLELAKIENMRSQQESLAGGAKPMSTDDLEEEAIQPKEKAPATPAAPAEKYGFLAVCSGEGMHAVFCDLGADGIVSGGQTMNPSTESLLEAVNAIHAETVFILPNNSNIIMAARQCAELSERQIVVIPTKSVPQGIAAMMALDRELPVDELAAVMTDAAGEMMTGQLTRAARDSEYDGFTISEGDYLILVDGHLFGSDKQAQPLLDQLAQEVSSRGMSYITIFSGESVAEEDAQKVTERFRKQCTGAEVSLIHGGQPVYDYVFAIE